ncbi:hypothetical protein C1H46_009264 [Malus baccata]|uniref:Uncharacterized protein n=1 Tax=Malus baccata TaxID=106549 RepID=A0A540N242_MALBA|nr:hypothetical protein C1H46_009264 [Malus baccata]
MVGDHLNCSSVGWTLILSIGLLLTEQLPSVLIQTLKASSVDGMDTMVIPSVESNSGVDDTPAGTASKEIFIGIASPGRTSSNSCPSSEQERFVCLLLPYDLSSLDEQKGEGRKQHGAVDSATLKPSVSFEGVYVSGNQPTSTFLSAP